MDNVIGRNSGDNQAKIPPVRGARVLYGSRSGIVCKATIVRVHTMELVDLAVDSGSIDPVDLTRIPYLSSLKEGACIALMERRG